MIEHVVQFRALNLSGYLTTLFCFSRNNTFVEESEGALETNTSS